MVRALRYLAILALLCAPMAWAHPPLDDDDTGLIRKSPPEPVGFFVTSKGTADCLDNECSIENVHVSQGKSLVVFVVTLDNDDCGANGGITTVSWGGASLTEDIHICRNNGLGQAVWCGIFSAHGLTAGTNNVVALPQPSALGVMVAAVQVSGVSAFDTGSQDLGSNTHPTCNLFINNEDEVLFGFVVNTDGVPGPVGGAWDDSFLSLFDEQSQGAGTRAYSIGYRFVHTSAPTYTPGKTGTRALSDWAVIGAGYNQ